MRWKLKSVARMMAQARRMPVARIDLMLRESAGNDPFYGQVVRDFHDSARRPHPKFRVVGAMEFGVALTPLPPQPDEYPLLIEASARFNRGHGWVRAARRPWRRGSERGAGGGIGVGCGATSRGWAVGAEFSRRY